MQEVRGSNPLSSTLRSSRFSEGLIHVWALGDLRIRVRHSWRACSTGCAVRCVPGWLLCVLVARSGACSRCWAGVFVVVRGAGYGLRRCCDKAGQGFAAPAAGPRGEAGGGAAGVVVLASVPCGGGGRVVGDGQAGGEQHPGCQAHDAAPAAGGVAGGGVFEGGEDAFGAGAPVIGAAVRGGGVVVFLRGLGQDVRGDGEGLLGAAGGRGFRSEDAFGAGAPVIGAAVRGGGVVVFLRGLGQDVRGDGEGLLGAAGGRVL